VGVLPLSKQQGRLHAPPGLWPASHGVAIFYDYGMTDIEFCQSTA